MPCIVKTACVRPISHTSRLSSSIRNTSASASPICRARFACACGIPRDDDRQKNDVVDAEHDFQRGQGQQRRPCFRAGQQSDHVLSDRDEPDRRVAAHDIGGDRAKRRRDGSADVEIVGQRDDRKQRPDADQRQGQPAQAHHAYRVNDVERSKGQHDQDRPRQGSTAPAANAAGTDRMPRHSTTREIRENDCPRLFMRRSAK